MNGEPLEMRDPRAAVVDLEAHGARAAAVDLDHESPVPRRIGDRTLELGSEGVAIAGRAAAEERLDVRVIQELEQEVEIVDPCSPDRDHGVSAAGARRGKRSVPVPSATPARMSSSPPIAEAVTFSSRKIAP